MKSKYVIFDNGGIKGAIIFPEYLNHSDFKFGFGEIVSAGFVDIAIEGGKDFAIPYALCYGKSDSLNLPSKEGDKAIIEQTLRIGNFYR